MRVMVTGGAGFIGSHIVNALLARGHEVAVLDNLRTGLRSNIPSDATFFEVDVCDNASVDRAFQEFQPNAVSHQAAQTSVAVSVREPAEDARINILGGLNVLHASVKLKSQRFVFASTGGAIYGEVPDGQRADTTWPANPQSPYAASKRSFEHYLAIYKSCYGLDYHSLRYANVYGPRQDPHGEAGVVAIFANALRTSQGVKLFGRTEPGDGGCIRDYIYIDDVVRANLAALDGTLPDTTLNVATGLGTTTQALLDAMCEIAATNTTIQHLPPPGDLQRSVLEPSHPLLGTNRAVTLTEGLVNTLAWFKYS